MYTRHTTLTFRPSSLFSLPWNSSQEKARWDRLAVRLLLPSSPLVVGNSWREAGKFFEQRWRHAPRRRANYCRFDLSLPRTTALLLFADFLFRSFSSCSSRCRGATLLERERERENYFFSVLSTYIGKSAIAFRFLGRQFPFGSRSSTVHLGHTAAP